MRSVLTALAVTVLAAPLAAGDIPLTGQNTKIEFTGTKPDGKHTGGFDKLSGSISLDGNDPTAAKITVEIDMASLHSDNPMLTAHLKAPDFFEVKKYPTSKFVSTAIKAGDGGTYTVTGDLTMHGVTKSISFPAKITATAANFELTSEFNLDRTQFGMVYGKGKIKDETEMKISVKADRK